MKNLVYTNGTAIMIDPSSLEMAVLNSDREGIQRIYRIREDCKVKAVFGDKTFEKDAKAGDMLITFYDEDFPSRAIIIRSDEWNENLAEYDKRMQARKEMWAKEKELKNEKDYSRKENI